MDPTDNAEDILHPRHTSKIHDAATGVKDGVFKGAGVAYHAVGGAVTGAAQNVSDAARPYVVNQYTEAAAKPFVYVAKPVIKQYNNLLSPVVSGEGDGFGEDVANSGKEEVVLRIEISASSDVKLMRTCTFLAVGFSTLATAILVAMKFQLDANEELQDSDNYFISSVVISGVFLIVLLAVAVVFTHRIIDAWRNGLVWSKRRINIAGNAFVILILQILNLSCMFASAAYSIIKKCGWQSDLVYSLGFVQWTLWDFTLLLLVCLAHNGSIWRGKTKDKSHNKKTEKKPLEPPSPQEQREEEQQQPVTALVMDAPMRIHLPKLILWMILQASLIISLLKFLFRGYGSSCLSSGPLTCPNHEFALLGVVIHICILWAYFIMYCYFAWRTDRDLKLRPYTEMRMARMVFGIQHEQVLPVFLIFTVCTTLILVIEFGSCWTFVQTWMGVVPLQAMGTMMAGSLCFYFMPKKPGSADEVLQTWLQEFVWSEEQMPEAIRRRNAKLAASSTLAEKPMFCIETAIKLLYYSEMAYIVTEKDVQIDSGGGDSGGAAADGGGGDSGSKTTPALPKVAAVEKAVEEFNIGFAKSLYQLNNAQVFHDKDSDTLAVLLWGNNTIVIAFKGTSSFENALTDLNLFKTIHPPRRTAPMSAFWGSKLVPVTVRVHTGFLAAWTGNGFDQRVLAKVNQIVNEEFSYPDPESNSPSNNNTSATNGSSPVSIYLTGHSLGGALASLAAHAIKTAHPSAHLICYTFGSPRVGNKSFAYEYNNLIHDHFGCISGQDPVARQPKGWYKRLGERVLIDNLGNIIVRPSYLEMHLINRMAPKVSDHYTSTYRLSFMRAIKMQVASWKGEEGDEAREMALGIDLNKVLLGVYLSQEDLENPDLEPMTLEQFHKLMESRKEQ